MGNATGTITPKDCPEGSYCLENTTSANSYPCPPGTYNNRTALETEDDCQACTGGMYCEDYGKVLHLRTNSTSLKGLHSCVHITIRARLLKTNDIVG